MYYRQLSGDPANWEVAMAVNQAYIVLHPSHLKPNAKGCFFITALQSYFIIIQGVIKYCTKKQDKNDNPEVGHYIVLNQGGYV